ncbi:metalloprotease [Massospora cicadina]|nr:metalloprotease [Massospora cicadina]
MRGFLWLLLGAGWAKFRKRWTRSGVAYRELEMQILRLSMDRGDYRLIRLANGMEILVGQDRVHAKASMVLDVKVGFRHDPPNVRGLAHLCEHMLTSGSVAYQRPNAYASVSFLLSPDLQLIEANAGTYNAHTSYEHTVYHFKDFQQHARGPLFDEGSLKAELKAIDDEFVSKVQNDDMRLEMAARLLGDKDHPYMGHHGGNCRSLLANDTGISGLREELVRFHATTYSAHRMRLVIMGPAPVEDLIEGIVPLFSAVPKTGFRDAELPDPFPPSYYYQGNHGSYSYTIKVVVCDTVQNVSRLRVRFKLPTLDHLQQTKPDKYIAYMLCQSGAGSILALLKSNGWAVDITCGVAEYYSHFAFFDFDVVLTPHGIHHATEIIHTIFQAVNLIREAGILPSFYQELGVITLMHWIFNKRERPLDHSQEIAKMMHLVYPPRRVLYTPLLFDFNSTIIAHVLNQFIVENLRVTLYYKHAPTNLRERMYNISYSIVELSNLRGPDQLGRNPSLKLPTMNRFIATEFKPAVNELARSKFPARILVAEDGELWAHAAQSNSPKSIAYLSISPGRATSLLDVAILDLLANLIMESLDEINFHLTQAGYEYEVTNQPRGLELRVAGFHQKFPLLFQKVVARIVDPPVEASAFAMFKQMLLDRIQDEGMEMPMVQAAKAIAYALGQVTYSRQELFAATAAIEIPQLQSYTRDLFAHGSLLMYLRGNVNATEAANLYLHIARQFNLSHAVPAPISNPTLPAPLVEGSSFYYRFNLIDTQEPDSGLGFYLHLFDAATPRLEALTRVAVFFLEETFFYQVRYVKQLCYQYHIAIHGDTFGGGLLISLQSRRDPANAERHLEEILFDLKWRIQNMTEEQFRGQRVTLVRHDNKRLSDKAEARKVWSQLLTRNFQREPDPKVSDHYPNLHKADVIDFLDTYVLHAAPHRKKLSVHALSRKTFEVGPYEPIDSCGTRIVDLAGWRAPNPSL